MPALQTRFKVNSIVKSAIFGNNGAKDMEFGSFCSRATREDGSVGFEEIPAIFTSRDTFLYQVLPFDKLHARDANVNETD